jgi:hypothetical protein
MLLPPANHNYNRQLFFFTTLAPPANHNYDRQLFFFTTLAPPANHNYNRQLFFFTTLAPPANHGDNPENELRVQSCPPVETTIVFCKRSTLTTRSCRLRLFLGWDKLWDDMFERKQLPLSRLTMLMTRRHQLVHKWTTRLLPGGAPHQALSEPTARHPPWRSGGKAVLPWQIPRQNRQ